MEHDTPTTPTPPKRTKPAKNTCPPCVHRPPTARRRANEGRQPAHVRPPALLLDRQHPAPRRPARRRQLADAAPRTPTPPPPHAPKKAWVPAPPRPSTYTVPLPHGLPPLASSRSSARSPWGPGPFFRPRPPSPSPENNFSQNSPLTVSPSRVYYSRHRSDGRSTRGCHGPVGAARFRGPADAK